MSSSSLVAKPGGGNVYHEISFRSGAYFHNICGSVFSYICHNFFILPSKHYGVTTGETILMSGHNIGVGGQIKNPPPELKLCLKTDFYYSKSRIATNRPYP